MLRFANATASQITTRKGALKVMPSREEVANIISIGRRETPGGLIASIAGGV